MLQQPEWTRAFVKVSNEAWFAGFSEAPSLLKQRLAKVLSMKLLPVKTIEEIRACFSTIQARGTTRPFGCVAKNWSTCLY